MSIHDDFTVIIEIPAGGGSVKYEIDKKTGRMAVDRFMPTAMYYPCNYGFVPNTLSEDGDPVDVLVITPEPVFIGCSVQVRALGILQMEDEAGLDGKLLALPIPKLCAEFAHIQSLNDLSPVMLKKIEHFFEQYKALESGKWVKVKGWKGVDVAAQELHDGIQRYSKQT